MGNIEDAVGQAIHPWVAEGRSHVRFGIFGGTGADWRESVAWAQRIEELGFDSFWTGDHPIHFPFDCWTHLAVLASATSRIRLGSLVSCPFYRHPTILARQVADVDRLSGGRVALGLGIGDDPPECRGLGIPYGSVRERQTALERALTILPALRAAKR